MPDRSVGDQRIESHGGRVRDKSGTINVTTSSACGHMPSNFEAPNIAETSEAELSKSFSRGSAKSHQ